MAGRWSGHHTFRVITAHPLPRDPRTDTPRSEDNMTVSSTHKVPVEDIGAVEVTVPDRGAGHPVVPRSGRIPGVRRTGHRHHPLPDDRQVARQRDATLLQVGTPHFFDEVAAATG